MEAVHDRGELVRVPLRTELGLPLAPQHVRCRALRRVGVLVLREERADVSASRNEAQQSRDHLTPVSTRHDLVIHCQGAPPASSKASVTPALPPSHLPPPPARARESKPRSAPTERDAVTELRKIEGLHRRTPSAQAHALAPCLPLSLLSSLLPPFAPHSRETCGTWLGFRSGLLFVWDSDAASSVCALCSALLSLSRTYAGPAIARGWWE